MATDPAVQAAIEAAHWALHDLADWNWIGNCFPKCRLLIQATKAVAAVTPLIRAQAFTEAVDAIEAHPNVFHTTVDGRPSTDFGRGFETAQETFTNLVRLRGLGEETENA